MIVRVVRFLQLQSSLSECGINFMTQYTLINRYSIPPKYQVSYKASNLQMKAVILCCLVWTIPPLLGAVIEEYGSKGKQESGEKSIPVPLDPQQTSHKVSQNWNQWSKVIKQHLTTWIMVRPKITFIFSTRECISIDNHEFSPSQADHIYLWVYDEPFTLIVMKQQHILLSLPKSCLLLRYYFSISYNS